MTFEEQSFFQLAWIAEEYSSKISDEKTKSLAFKRKYPARNPVFFTVTFVDNNTLEQVNHSSLVHIRKTRVILKSIESKLQNAEMPFFQYTLNCNFHDGQKNEK